MKGKPKVMILIQEEVGGLFHTTAWENVGQAETTITDKFLTAGFNTVDPGQVKKNINRDMALRIFEGDNGAAQQEGLKYDAQVIVTGKAVSKFAARDLYNSRLQSVHASVNIRAISTDTGKILATAGATGTKAHIDEMQGGALAIKKASEKAADSLIQAIIGGWQQDVSSRFQEITLMISGLVSYRHLTVIRKVLSTEIKGVRQVYQRSYTGGVAELMLDCNGTSSHIADELARREFNGFELNPTNVTANRIDVKVELLQ